MISRDIILPRALIVPLYTDSPQKSTRKEAKNDTRRKFKKNQGIQKSDTARSRQKDRRNAAIYYQSRARCQKSDRNVSSGNRQSVRVHDKRFNIRRHGHGVSGESRSAKRKMKEGEQSAKSQIKQKSKKQAYKTRGGIKRIEN